MLLYYITSRAQFSGSETDRRRSLLAKIGEAARWGVDYVQLREKDLSMRELEHLAQEVVHTIAENTPLRTGNKEPGTKLLINSRADIARAVGAEGVHLRADDISCGDIRHCWRSAQAALEAAAPLISISCHNPADVACAAAMQADLALFAPIFEKKDAPNSAPAGLEALREACRNKVPVLALGGVSLENAGSCSEAGAAGIAAIRLFQENEIEEVVLKLRSQ